MTKVLCLGGAGRICREAALDLVQFSDFEQITIGDSNEAAGREVVTWLNDPRVDFVRVDVAQHAETVARMRAYDIVMDGTTISLNKASTACIAEAGAHGINLNGFGEEYAYDQLFKDHGRLFVPGFGMTPGTTNMMARLAADALDTVDIVRVSHGAFRPVAFSASIAETTVYEYDPRLPGRVVYENGQFIQVPPFARPRDITLPAPYGTLPEYIIPHSETRTLSTYLAHKGVRLIEVRGTWPAKNMQLVRTLYDWGFLRNDPILVDGHSHGILDLVAQYLLQSKEGHDTDLYGYALHVEVIGARQGQKQQVILTHTHPASDGSVPGLEKLRAYTRCVGIPMAIGVQLIARGRAHGQGVVIPEYAFDPADVFAELEKRHIFIHQQTTGLADA